MWIRIVAVLAAIAILVGSFFLTRRYLASQNSPCTKVYEVAARFRKSNIPAGNSPRNTETCVGVATEIPISLEEEFDCATAVEMTVNTPLRYEEKF